VLGVLGVFSCQTRLKWTGVSPCITGLHLGNFEVPFLQYYQPNNVFRAHYGQSPAYLSHRPPSPGCGGRGFANATPEQATHPNSVPMILLYHGVLDPMIVPVLLLTVVVVPPTFRRTDMYQVDMAKPFPYHDNQRSATLLAYLADTDAAGGGETEFMLAEPRQGLTLVQFSAQPEPFLTQNTPNTPRNTP